MPSVFLAALDDLENRYGKLSLFLVKDLCDLTGVILPPVFTGNERKNYTNNLRDALARLESLGLIEGPSDNRFALVGNRQYRLTKLARTQLEYR